jgi:nucleoside-diphosphate-sugar epimerase
MDSRRLLSLGWEPTVGLNEGLARAYAQFVKRHQW